LQIGNCSDLEAAVRIPFLQAPRAALNANDVASAETELSRSTSVDLLTKAVRADLVKRYGNNRGTAPTREEILASSIKMDGGQQIDPLSLAGRLHAEKM